MLIGIVATEVSADLLGAELMREIKKSLPEATFVGSGGDLMRDEDLEMLCHISQIEAIGIIEVAMRLVPLLRLRSRIIKQLKERKPDVFIGIDGPDFCGRIEAKLSEAGIPCVHYVCPSIWVWRKRRGEFFSRVNRQILCLYPCEKRMIEEFGGSATFVGHPLADAVPVQLPQLSAQRNLDLTAWIAGRKVVGILPGSRSSEIGSLLASFLATARIMSEQRPLAILVSAVSRHKYTQVRQLVKKHGDGLDLRIIVGESQQLIASSDMVIVASGTASLEALLVNRPMIVAYRINRLSSWLFRWLMKRGNQPQRNLLTGEPIPHPGGEFPLVSQPNLLSGERVVPEFLQHQIKPQSMAGVCLELLEKDNSELTARFHRIHLTLRNNASFSAARVILPLLLERAGLMKCTDAQQGI